MLVIPAIDIKAGKVVRLFKGDYSQEKVYSSDPLEVALYLDELGFRRIHIVDLNGVQKGIPRNKKIIKKIALSTRGEIEVGGGIRSRAIISEYLNSGVNYVVIGTRAYLDPEWFKDILRRWDKRIILALDILEGEPRIKGWRQGVDKDILKQLEFFSSSGLKTVIYTDVSRDGTLLGLDLNAFREFLFRIKHLELKVIFSGGVAGKEDLEKIKTLRSSKIQGIIVGKAFYEGRVNLSEFKGGKL